MFRTRFALALVLGALVTGCAATPGADLAPFGSSVRQAMDAQTYRHGDQVPVLRGDSAARSIRSYRGSDATQPALGASGMSGY